MGNECIIGALCFVPEVMEISSRKVVACNPVKIVKEVSDEMIKWKSEGTKWYQRLPQELHKTLKECKPLQEVPENRVDHQVGYETWKRHSD